MDVSRRTRIAGLVLAAGLSRRLEGKNKLLLPVGSRTVVERTVSAYLEALLDPVVVVVGHDADRVLAALGALPVESVRNPDFALGQSSSLGVGVSAVPESAAAAVIGVGDQPLLDARLIRELVQAFRTGGARIVAPCFAGQRGNPVLFSRSLFPELMQVRGDTGGRQVLRAHEDEIQWVDQDDTLMAVDVDTWEQYQAVRATIEERESGPRPV